MKDSQIHWQLQSWMNLHHHQQLHADLSAFGEYKVGNLLLLRVLADFELAFSIKVTPGNQKQRRYPKLNLVNNFKSNYNIQTTRLLLYSRNVYVNF